MASHAWAGNIRTVNASCAYERQTATPPIQYCILFSAQLERLSARACASDSETYLTRYGMDLRSDIKDRQKSAPRALCEFGTAV